MKIELTELEPWAYEFIEALRPGAHGFVFCDGALTGGGPYWEFPHGRPLRVVMSGRTELDGKRWIHVSVSNRGRLPSWEAMKLVHAAFIGEDKRAIQVFAPKSEHVNIAEVLHLWYCLDGDGLPDFRVIQADGIAI